MNVQPMTLDINSLRAPQKPASTQLDTKKEDSFSSVLEKSKDKQELPSKQKVNNKNDDIAKTTKEKVEADSKAPVTKEADKTDDTKLEELSAKDKEAKLMRDIAQMLDITVGELEGMLASLQIGLSELLQDGNMQKLMMQVHGVDDPMDLLLIPEVASQIKAVSEVVEEYITSTVTQELDGSLLGVADKMMQDVRASESSSEETTIKPESQSLATTNQKAVTEASDAKQSNQTKEVAVENTPLKQGTDGMARVNLAELPDEGLSQNEEQSTSNQNNTANQFLDQLTQSMWDALRTNSNQVNETFETVMPRTEALNPRMVLDQIVDKIKISTIENEAIMNIQLKPEHLGKLSMEVVSKQGIMTAQITVENEKTKAILEQNIQSLKENLEDKGLVIQELEVAIGHSQGESGNQAYEAPRSNRNISDIISSMMEEEVTDEVIEGETKQNILSGDTNEVDFIA